MKYYPTPLESWVSNLYKQLNIIHPNEIDQRLIARHFRIFLIHNEINTICYERGQFRSITIDSRLNYEQQYESFFHELCHLLRHAGWQTNIMPKAFRELQEYDSRNFTRYAAIPFHMLKYIDFQDPYLISTVSETFNVSPELAYERLERIKYSAVNRILSVSH